VEHPCLKVFVKKKGEGSKTKGDAKDLDAIRGAT
jgi:hypothetical protein